MHETETDTDVTESQSESEYDSDTTTAEEDDPWIQPIQDAFKFHHDTFKERVEELTSDGLDENKARARVFQSMLPAYREFITERYMHMITWNRDINKDPVGIGI